VSRRLRTLSAAAIIGLLALLVITRSASAEANGVGLKPVMGWSSWDYLRHDPTEAVVEAEAQAMVSSGLSSVGYRYVNLDDYWYACPGPQGPDVDQYGRWIPDAAQFPSQGSVNGIAATAAYVHHLGLKFGIYVTPGISLQAVAQKTPIQGTRSTANQIATTTAERNYNCHGMVGIDYAKPGAQAFVDSWADELAAWGVDYVKLDGVGRSDIADVKAWSQALRQTHRAIGLELSNNLAISDASAWQQYANGWRTGPDIDCYCSGSSFPLTDWTNVEQRFNEVADWAPYGHPGAFNDYDSIEVGNGAGDGLTAPERQTQLSLWALGAAPLILGADLTQLDPLDRSYLLNRRVIAVDQDGIDARRIVHTSTAQLFAKREHPGNAVVGLFNTTSAPRLLTVDQAQLGLPRSGSDRVTNLWTGASHLTGARVGGTVPADGVFLLRVTATARGTHTSGGGGGGSGTGGAPALVPRDTVSPFGG
jgi:alpha galactosidase A-like protein/alpha galactosidase C-like protein